MNQTRRTLLQAILGLFGFGAAKAVATPVRDTDNSIDRLVEMTMEVQGQQFNIGVLDDKEMLNALRRLYRRINWTSKRGPIEVSPDLQRRLTVKFKKQMGELHWMPPLNDDGELRFKGCRVLENERLPKNTVRFVSE